MHTHAYTGLPIKRDVAVMVERLATAAAVVVGLATAAVVVVGLATAAVVVVGLATAVLVVVAQVMVSSIAASTCCICRSQWWWIHMPKGSHEAVKTGRAQWRQILYTNTHACSPQGTPEPTVALTPVF